MTVVTRFAPSPTGRLHLGHAYSAILAHDLARASGGRFLLRIEDIDPGRTREEHIAGIVADLRWLGLAWDGAIVRQSERLDVYAAALDRLKAMGLVYPCFCTRAEIAASAAAPHGDEGPVYPGTCRALSTEDRARRMASEQHCWRMDMGKAITPSPRLRGEGWGEGDALSSHTPFAETDSPSPNPLPASGERALLWHDASAGWITADPASHGDVVLARKDAPTSYHLAVTIDDAAQGVTDIVRGVDLFAATHVHRLLQALLGFPTPRYHHHKLLTDADGRRLAKRHGSPSLADLRAGGADPQALVADLRAGRVPLGFASAEA